MQKTALQTLIRTVESTGVSVERERIGFSVYNQDLVFPYIIITLCLRGRARSRYDMQELKQSKNDLALIMPGHILRPIDTTEDYTYARIAISSQMFKDLRLSSFSHDYEKFNYAPMCRLTDEQAAHLISIVHQLAMIVERTEDELPHRREILLAQLAVGYEFLNCYRREMDKQWTENRHAVLYNRFCELVVAHYKESREVKYYAELLHLTPKYFSTIFREASQGISPGRWIEQYVATQAKHLIQIYPNRSIKEIAFMLGFSEPTAFYRYFKHATGITALEFKNSLAR